MRESKEPLVELSELVDHIPQIDNRGLFRYLLGCGASVTLITQFSRPITDIDRVMLKLTPELFNFPDIDVATPTNFWADIRLSSRYLRNTAYWVNFEVFDKRRQVATVHPAITLVQKASVPSFLHREPREKDKKDYFLLSNFLLSGSINRSEWEPIINKSIASLPASRQARSRETVSTLLNL